MSEAAADDWIRRIELYLELGSEGVVVLVDKARDALIGNLVRALVRKYPDLTIVVSPEELREVPPGSVVLYHADAEHAERLNLIRPVLKDRKLRVVLWAQGELGSQLPLRAPDLYDWISHRVECPREGAPPFVALGLRAARTAGRVVWWDDAPDTLRIGVKDAWPSIEVLFTSTDDYDTLVDILTCTEDSFVVIEGLDGRGGLVDDGWHRIRWALAEARRRNSVAIIAPDTYLRSGYWHLDAEQRPVKEMNPELRVSAALLDLEWEPTVLLRRTRPEVHRRWRSECLDAEDPGALLTKMTRLMPRWESLMTGGAAPAFLRVWGREVSIPKELIRPPTPEARHHLARALCVAEPDAAPDIAWIREHIPVECELWSGETQSNWIAMAHQASRFGHFDIAVRWAARAGTKDEALALHAEQGVSRRSLHEARRVLDVAASKLGDDRPEWYKSLELRLLCDSGELQAARAEVANGREAIDASSAAYALTLLGHWLEAREAIIEAAQPGPPLRTAAKSALGLSAWANDCSSVIASALEPIPREQPTGEIEWTRWLPALGIVSLDDLFYAMPPFDELKGPLGSPDGAVTHLAFAVALAVSGRFRESNVFAAMGIARLEEELGPRDHVLEGVLLLVQGRALARLGQPNRAIDKLTVAETIVRRTSGNDRHPWALMARLERDWLRARHRGGSVEDVDAVLTELRAALWPEHRDLKEAEKLRARL